MRGGRQLAAVAVAVAAILVAGRLLAMAWTDFLWYDALGAGDLWRAKAFDQMLLQGGSAVAAGAFAFVNLYAVRHSVVKLVLQRRVGNLEIGAEVPSIYLLTATAVLSLLIGALLTFAQADWPTLAMARYVEPFSESDPYSNLDLRFYVGWLPLERALFIWAQATLVTVSVIVVLLYTLTRSLRWQGGALRVSSHVRQHFTVLGSLMLLLLAWSYRLDRYLLLIDGGTGTGLFGWVDDSIARPAAMALSILATAAAVFVLWAGFSGQIRMAFGVVTTVLVLALLLQQIVPAVAPRLAGERTPEIDDAPYAATREIFTRRAYAVDRVVLGDSPALANLGEAAAAVPVWDAAAVVAAVQRGDRPADVVGSIGWQRGAGAIEAVAVARAASGDSAYNWTLRIAAATRSHGNGQPQGELPFNEFRVAEPLVFPGARGHVVASDPLGTIAAPSFGSTWNRLAHAWREQDLALITRRTAEEAPRMVRVRDVSERVALLAPVFVQGADVIPAMVGDSLYWLVSLYAASRTYPLSWHVETRGREWTYFHHAGIAIVEALTGRVMLVSAPRPESITRSWMRRFPALFTSWDQLPAALERAAPPPLESGAVQAAAFGRANTVANGAGSNLLAAGNSADSVLAGDAVLFASPDQGGGTYWITPMTGGDDRLAGLFSVSGGASTEASYLPIATPGASIAPRWSEVQERLRSSLDGTRDAGQRTLAGQVRVIPIGNELAFAQPFFHWRTQDAPALSHVALIQSDTLSIGSTIGELAGEMESPPPPDGLPGAETFRQRVARLYAQMASALARGDWAAFGVAYDELGRAIAASR